MIEEYLLIGVKNARTARELSIMLNIHQRDVGQLVEKERRSGAPICASTDPKNPGYYLAETAEEIEEYCSRLHKRAGEIFKTRRALLATAEKMHEEAQKAARPLQDY